ncbi:lysophospholipid acyltransferase family protein [Nibricoccus sp. IMCC34717]|uniref:lysophospholipid acyltransferase family protein n=1 Tax=Nibricoccus sp. IMCC34717 TaxID=3034021 RepID=UPI00385134BA
MSGFHQVDMDPLYGFSAYLFESLYGMCFGGEIHGLANLPRQGGFIIASNHASHLDPPVVGCRLPRQVSYFARKTLWKKGLASWWLDGVGTIPVDRDGGSDVTAIKRVLGALKASKVIILFPEGTRSPDGNLQPPKPGVGLLACRTGVPVVPARVFGSFEAFGRSGGIHLGRSIHVVYGKPMAPAEYDHPADGKERYQRASERIMARIAAIELPRAVIV